MSVRDFMKTDLVTVVPETPIYDAIDLMKKHQIHRLPVLKDGKLIGLITESLIQEALPSKATSLSVYEVNYLLNKAQVKDVMIKDVEFIGPDALLEDAIAKMRKNNIGVLPVLENNQIVGIITNNDIFDAFLKITGYHSDGTRVALSITKDSPGVLAEISKVLAENSFSILTIVVNRMQEATIVELQIESLAVDKIKEILASAGFEVVSAVHTKQQ